jgi:hypothetical protein
MVFLREICTSVCADLAKWKKLWTRLGGCGRLCSVSIPLHDLLTILSPSRQNGLGSVP